MKYGVCTLSVVPCRAEAADASEQVSQLLFGEIFQVLEMRSKWIRIRSYSDRYESWIDKKQFTEISAEEFEHLAQAKPYVVNELFTFIQNSKTQEVIPLLLASSLPELNNNTFTLAGVDYHCDSNTTLSNYVSRNKIIETAFLYLNAPYLWGGRSVFGIDCSGFTQNVFKINGIALPRDAKDQAKNGQTLSFIEESESGDLAFFDNDEGNIIHVGILLNDNYIIHASGKVRVDRIDHQGIFNTETRSYTHKLRIIKKLIE
jgi:gamma-D-glutamyl-L-lysine dipeptidyl-peptidase